jgi:pilus assembly protein CpaF
VTSLSPLAEIEHRAQQRAEDLALDLSGDEGLARLRELVDDEVARWNHAFREGRRPTPLDNHSLPERALRNLAGYGPLGPLLADDDVWEIMVNAPDAVFVKRHRGADGYHDDVFHDDDHVLRVLTRILDQAAGAHRKLDPTLGLQDAQLDDGARLHIAHRDVSRGGHTMVNIRKFTGVAFRDLGELATTGMVDPATAALLSTFVRHGCSMVVSGRPGAGKTTLLSCCLAELDPRHRVVVAEEVFELDVPLANVASLQTRGVRPDRPEIDLRRLVGAFLRMAPDVAIVGEVRDREALPLLLTLSSGVAGFTTIHAGSARQALTRLRFVCQLADAAAHLPPAALTALVADTVDLVVHCDRGPDGPSVTEVLAVEDLASGEEAGRFTVTDMLRRANPGSPLAWPGALPSRLADRLDTRGIDLPALLRDRAAV